MPSITGIVLAGGKSSRMGSDKALLPIGGVPMLRLVCDRALSVCDRVYVVTPWQERYKHLLPATCQFIREVQPRGAENAPILGFAQGLAQVTTDWVLLLACDLPQLQVEVLQGWVKQLNNCRAIALLPRHAKGWEPLCGFYRRDCLTALTGFIDTGERSFQSWLKQQSVQVLTVTDAQMFFNCNTPDDVAATEKKLISRGDGLAIP
ncbi:molybdenum cofactor guanylyltransferase [Synechocystis sp. PCC 7509]|uniref:molybdenum cofactor guanylyltransferase n=1 Tax=Synechocystis sp. PCC 7509 TaxID=927677 RepID=UPI0002AC852B|nr:molybdenum cofactor guanylyltransferase [Synechocystis sp. PCC 7509]